MGKDYVVTEPLSNLQIYLGPGIFLKIVIFDASKHFLSLA